MAKTIIGVGSNSSINLLLQTVLGKEFTFLTAASVYDGMALLRSRQVDLVIADFDFQEEACRSFVQHIKTSKLFNVPVFVLASCSSSKEAGFYDHLVDEFFCKPFSPIELVNAARELLRPAIHTTSMPSLS